MDKVITSPIRYPGGKRWLFKTLSEYLPKVDEMVSPFMGGGAIELNLSARGVKVYGYDICPHLTNFWKHWISGQYIVQKDAETLLDGWSHEDLVSEKHDRFLGGSAIKCDSYMQAVWYYLFNKLCIHGLVFEPYIVPYEKYSDRWRWAVSDYRQVFPKFEGYRDYALSVSQSSFGDTLTKHPNTFAYLDPPYVGTEDIYKDGAGFDHYLLSEILHSRDNWILSYSDSDIIRQLYQGHRMLELVKTSGFHKAGKNKKQHELLIFSHDIAENIAEAERLKPKQLTLF